MPRRVNRHLFIPPLPQRAGIDPVSLTLPAHPAPHETTQEPEVHPSTVAQYLITRFSPEDPATILDCFARHEVQGSSRGSTPAGARAMRIDEAIDICVGVADTMTGGS